MSTTTRLIVALGAVLVVVMVSYGVYAQRQREDLLGAAHLRETEMMARLLSGVLSDAVRDGRMEDFRPLMQQAREHPEVVALTLVDSTGKSLWAGPSSVADCLAPILAAIPARSEASGATVCEGHVDWVVLPHFLDGGSLLVARRATALEREMAAARRQVVAVTLVLTFAGAAVIVVILRRSLSRPLDAMLTAVDRLGDPHFTEPVSVPECPGELGRLARAFNDLDRRLEEKTKWIIKEVEERIELEKRLRTAERFAAAGRIVGGLAHELGSPLNVIGVRAEAILRAGPVADNARRHAEEIVDEVDRIAALVQSLSHVGRNGVIEPRLMDLVDMVRGAATDLIARAGQARVHLVMELPENPVKTLGDRALLRLAVRNLIANAVQAAAAGSGSVWVRVAANEEVTTVEVEDDGPGIPADVLSRVFEPFFTTKDVDQGTGLGLSTALGIVERHGGQLHIESVEGRGVKAVLQLPIAGDEDIS